MNIDINLVIIFVFGCLGAAAPEILRAYRTSSSGRKITWRTCLVSILFFLLGGVVAIALQSTTSYAAFYSGVAAPIIISQASVNTTSTLSRAKNRGHNETTGFLILPQKSSMTVREYLGMLSIRQEKTNELA